MSIKKDNAIKKIFNKYEKFSKLVLAQLELLDDIFSKASLDISKDTLKQIEENEKKLDQFEVEISEQIINTIVLYHPVASELRNIMACYRITINIERIGDLIKNIVNYIKKIKDPDIFKKSISLIENMLAISSDMVSRALNAFANNDREYAIWTIKNDEVVDELNSKLLKKAIVKEKFSGDTQKILLNFLNIKSIISNIERIADHATNIAEASIYAMDGKDIRHQELE